MKIYTIALLATLFILSKKGEARSYLKGKKPPAAFSGGAPPEKQRRKLADSEIDVTFNGLRVYQLSGVDAGDEEEWLLDFKVEAFRLDFENLTFDRIADDDDSFSVNVPEDNLGRYLTIDGETTVVFDESEWGNDDIRLYKLTVSGTEQDESIEENNSPDDPLPSCSRVFMHRGRRFNDSVECQNDNFEFKVYFKVDED